MGDPVQERAKYEELKVRNDLSCIVLGMEMGNHAYALERFHPTTSGVRLDTTLLLQKVKNAQAICLPGTRDIERSKLAKYLDHFTHEDFMEAGKFLSELINLRLGVRPSETR